MKEKIIQILENIRPENNYIESKHFIADGLLDSMDLMTLVTDLETEFEIRIDWLELVPDDFVNIDAIENFVKRIKENV